MSGARAAAPAAADADKGRVAAALVRRYRAGQAPTWAAEGEQAAGDAAGGAPADAVPSSSRVVAPPVVLEPANDPRLARLAGLGGGGEGGRRRVREVVAPEILSEGVGPSAAATAAAVDDDDDLSADERARRREATRSRARTLAADAEKAAAAAAAAAPASSSSSYETDADDSDDSLTAPRLLKPVFVPRGARDTAAERDAAAAEEEAAEAAAAARAVARKAEARALVAAVVAADEAAVAAANAPTGDGADVVTDDDALDPDAEFAAWKVRELSRLQREADIVTADEAAAAERAALASMTEAERAARAAAIKADRDAAKAPRVRTGPMERYHHRGAFYQAGADAPPGVGAGGGDYGVAAAVAARDAAAAAAGPASSSRSSLPKVMQVRNFGRAGQSKHTRLADQDTTARPGDDALAAAGRERARSLAGTGDVDKPRGYRT